MDKTFFAYHLAHFFGPFGLESYHTNSETATEADLIYVVSGHDASDGGKDYALEGLFRVHRRERGPFKLTSLNGKPMDFSYRLSLIAVRMPAEPIMMVGQDWYVREEMHRFFSSGQNFNPIQPRFKERFDLLLAEFADDRDGLATDIQEVAQRPNLSPTERDTLTRARVGQGRFRADVVALWGKGESCALSGIDLPELLIASHVKPWRDSSDHERLDPCNGLLLATHIDKAFDRHLLSFRENSGDFVVAVHPRATKTLSNLGVKNSMRLAVSHMNLSNSARFARYMEQHFGRHEQLLLRDRPR